jgi:hypothetical protein
LCFHSACPDLDRYCSEPNTRNLSSQYSYLNSSVKFPFLSVP